MGGPRPAPIVTLRDGTPAAEREALFLAVNGTHGATWGDNRARAGVGEFQVRAFWKSLRMCQVLITCFYVNANEIFAHDFYIIYFIKIFHGISLNLDLAPNRTPPTLADFLVLCPCFSSVENNFFPLKCSHRPLPPKYVTYLRAAYIRRGFSDINNLLTTIFLKSL